ncbi:unnamed protein product [Pseudo-nitzschia multistriata]|uniref:PNPLA domain-containing protein n=1 Tax=Pseudo-nitzschia multistriata TaxID=183589 RepID=A0A448ZBW2_9STRA|nr:unnamed protein product [Pseudo-nitzschia multistriata]
MCRRVSGRSVGLVLGAGGARGIAHLGVIRALKEAGVTVDIVGGTSQGAFCGALFARYPDNYDQVLSSCRVMAEDAASMKEKLLDLTLPMASMFAGRRFNRVQVPSMGDIQDMLIWVSSEQHRKSVKIVSDLYLTPPIQDVGTLEYDRFDEIVEKSYLYSKPIVDEWVQKHPWLVSSRNKVV